MCGGGQQEEATATPRARSPPPSICGLCAALVPLSELDSHELMHTLSGHALQARVCVVAPYVLTSCSDEPSRVLTYAAGFAGGVLQNGDTARAEVVQQPAPPAAPVQFDPLTISDIANLQRTCRRVSAPSPRQRERHTQRSCVHSLHAR